MTQEEKAKAYDEALALAKRLISNNCTEVEKRCLECIFPELKESEDERIRKWLLECVENLSNGNFIEVSKQDVLSYLEKQKEQEEIPLMNGNADLYFDNWIQHNDTTKRGCFEEGIRYAERLQKEQKLEVKDPFDDDQFRRGYESGYADAKREQKPAEWSDEDEKMRIKTLEALSAYADHVQYTGFCANSEVIRGELMGWLKSLPERLNLQPKQEWNEEDEKMRNALWNLLKIQYAQDYSMTGVGIEAGKLIAEIKKRITTSYMETNKETTKGNI